MNFATPLAFAWTALAVPIVIFYILKIRLRRIPVSTSIFWRQIFDEKQPRSLWQQLRHWMSLLVQLLMLALLVLALTDPYFSWEILQARRLVLVVDNSASMNATDVSPSRLAMAKKIAGQSIAALRMRDEMAIVTAGTEPQVVCGMTGHQRTLRDKLASVSSTDGPTRVREAVGLARRLLGDHPHGQIILLSDGGFPECDELSRSKDMQMHLVGTRESNVGITRWQVRRSLLDPLGYEILAEVFNASDDPVRCRLEVDLNGLPVDVVPLELEPGATWNQVLQKTSADGGTLVAHLTHQDSLAADNTAWAILPKRERQKVVLVSQQNHFLQKAIEANSLVDITTSKELPASFDSSTIYFLHRKTPQKIPNAPVFVIDPTNDCDLWKVGEKLSNPIVTKQDMDSMLMRHVRLDNVLMPDARQLFPVQPMQTLVQAVSGDALLAAMDRSQGKVLVLTVNLDEGDLTFRTAFPILVTNALSWFAGQAGELRESLATGSTAPFEFSAQDATTGGQWVLRSPDGRNKLIAHESTVGAQGAGGRDGRSQEFAFKTTLGPFDRCGIWSVEKHLNTGGPSEQKPTVRMELACNLANKLESDVRMPQDSLAETARPTVAAGLLTRPIWFYLVAVSWLLLTIEWWLYQRRWLG